ncbi:MAG TPA: hypothetical protein VJ812_14725 [Gemmatimonadaceae bacterium]|jgi:uncharacterized protein YbaR (Trm112 family)|nr:hypothetical protein [Gemmatimonadaceae bacterium]
MFIELVDQLRCPRTHEPSWLVAAIDRAHDRDILEGTLGCPACATRYPVHRGIADLRLPEARQAPPDEKATGAAASDEEALRLAAFLDLVEPGGFVALAGDWAELAPTLTRLIDGVHALTVDPPSPMGGVAGVSVMLASGGIPIRAGAARGIALDAAHASAAHVADAVDALRGGGRLVMPAALPLPHTLTLLARDERYQVTERSPALSTPVSLTRAERG